MKTSTKSGFDQRTGSRRLYSRREFLQTSLKGTTAFTFLFLLNTLIGDTSGQGLTEAEIQELTANRTEIINLPYGVEVELDNISMSSLNRFMLDRFGIDISVLGINNISVLENGSYTFDSPRPNFEFLSIEAILQILEFCGITDPRIVGLESQQELISSIQNIFNIVHNGLISQFASQSRRLSVENFSGGIARNLQEANDKPMIAEGNPTVALLLSVKLIGDFLLYNPDSSTADLIRANINTDLIRSTFINLIRNEVTTTGPNHIPVNYLSIPDRSLIKQEYLPFTNENLIYTYNQQLSPSDLQIRLTQLSSSILSFLLEQGQSRSQANIEIEHMQIGYSLVPTAVEFINISNRILHILDNYRSLNSEVVTQYTGLYQFFDNINSFSANLNYRNISEETYTSLTAEEKVAYLLFALISFSSWDIINFSTANGSTFNVSEIITNLEVLFGNRSYRFLPVEIIQVAELVGLNRVYVQNPAYYSFDSLLDASNAQFYTILNVYNTAVEFVSSGSTISSSPSFSYNLGLSFIEYYRHRCFNHVDTTADPILQINSQSLQSTINGLNHYFNLSECTEVSFVSRNVLPFNQGLNDHNTGQILFRTKLNELSYEQEEKYLHEFKHGVDWKKIIPDKCLSPWV